MPTGHRPRVGASGFWDTEAPQGGGVCTLGTRQGVCWAWWQQDRSGRGACAGDLGRAGTPPVHLSEAPLFEGRVFIPVTCCLPGRAVHGAVGPVLSLLPTRCTWHLLCLQPPPAGPALPGASTPHLPWCGAEDEAPGRGQLGCRATLPHAHPHLRLCPASASDHAPGSGAAPGKAARGSLSPRQEPG